MNRSGEWLGMSFPLRQALCVEMPSAASPWLKDAMKKANRVEHNGSYYYLLLWLFVERRRKRTTEPQSHRIETHKINIYYWKWHRIKNYSYFPSTHLAVDVSCSSFSHFGLTLGNWRHSVLCSPGTHMIITQTLSRFVRSLLLAVVVAVVVLHRFSFDVFFVARRHFL